MKLKWQRVWKTWTPLAVSAIALSVSIKSCANSTGANGIAERSLIVANSARNADQAISVEEICRVGASGKPDAYLGLGSLVQESVGGETSGGVSYEPDHMYFTCTVSNFGKYPLAYPRFHFDLWFGKYPPSRGTKPLFVKQRAWVSLGVLASGASKNIWITNELKDHYVDVSPLRTFEFRRPEGFHHEESAQAAQTGLAEFPINPAGPGNRWFYPPNRAAH